jgi:hypothetical protein
MLRRKLPQTRRRRQPADAAGEDEDRLAGHRSS